MLGLKRKSSARLVRILVNKDADPLGQFGLLWHTAHVVHHREHAGRVLSVMERQRRSAEEPLLLCWIEDHGRAEGCLTFVPGGRPSLTGSLIRKDHELYSVSIDWQGAGPVELAEVACRLLDYEYQFPPNSGVKSANFVWSERPKSR